MYLSARICKTDKTDKLEIVPDKDDRNRYRYFSIGPNSPTIFLENTDVRKIASL